MDSLLAFIGTALPFEWAQHSFMRLALIAIVLITPLFGLLGTMVVNNRMAFLSDSLGHSALTGIAFGVLLGVEDPVWSMLGFAILYSISLIFVRNHSAQSTDTTIGVFSATVMALGLVILASQGGFNRYSGYLIGDFLSIAPSDILLALAAFALVLGFWLIAFNKLLLVSVNTGLASSRGLRCTLIETSFTILVAIIVMISIKWVGILIINSLLVLPAACARNIAKTTRGYLFGSVLIALISGIVGLILSYYLNTAAGATIVLCASACYVVSLLIRRGR